ncbi:MAG: hypothetical protein REI78_08655 [Pedobacter sp.]|nr:hypothetical protein [Pedobacter sp.]
MEIDLATKQQLTALLAEPNLVSSDDASLLAKLTAQYPYYQPLHLLLAKAQLLAGNTEHLATAALYHGGNMAYKVIHAPEKLNTRSLHIVGQAEIIDDQEESPIIRDQSPITDEQEIFDEIAEIPLPAKEDFTDEQEIYDEISELIPIDVPLAEMPEEEVYEEIAEISPNQELAQQETDTTSAAPNHEEISADELALENIVATDFFAFEKSFTTELNTAPNIPQPEEYDQDAEAQTVSKYNDDKLPYTFLWWLAKTRKEHEQIFQPYVTPKSNPEQAPGELQQQYVEHIFHLQTPFGMDEKSQAVQAVAHKSDEIIENFIKNEPQIRIPKADQLNNENKAKQSAEDHHDLVSETLASIYIEQMLYHKAIETYQKLSLKFPEKSRYFADLIQSLEKKI